MSSQIPNQAQTMVVADLMTGDLVTASGGDRVDDVRELILGSSLHAVPIVDERGNAVGIVTLADLERAQHGYQEVVAIMTPTVVSLDMYASVSEAAALMRAEHVHHVIVSEGHQTVGMLSSFDLLKALTPNSERQPSA